MTAVREMTPPPLEAGADLAGRSILITGLAGLLAGSLSRFFCYFVKTSEARELLSLQLDYLLAMTDAFHPEIDMWLANRDHEWAYRWPQLLGQVK